MNEVMTMAGRSLYFDRIPPTHCKPDDTVEVCDGVEK